jgi:MscS family membrane protein
MLSRDPEGDQSDGLPPAMERLLTVHVGKETVELQLVRVNLKAGLAAWLVSADSVALIPRAHQALVESPFESKLPQQLVTLEILDTPVWRWIALVVAAPVLWLVFGFLAWALLAVARPLLNAAAFRRPLQICLTSSGLLLFMRFASPSTLPRLFLERGLGLVFFLGVAWAGTVAVDLLTERWQSRLDPRSQAVRYSVLPLGRQVLK